MLANLKTVIQNAADTALAARFASFVERIHPARANHLQVLTYHRIDAPQSNSDLAPSTLSATPATFRRQMEHLSAHYRAVSLAEVIAAYRGQARIPPRAVLITFDDAYQDFADHAWPILRDLGLPATLFVPTAYPDHPERTFWWDRLYHAITSAEAAARCEFPWGIANLSTPAKKLRTYRRAVAWIKSLPHHEAMHRVDELAETLQAPPAHSHVLSWDALRRLSAEGLAIGAHTQIHPLLSRISPEEAFAEAAGSLADLRREIPETWPVFAYPGGKFNPAAIEAVRAAGFELAFTTGRGINDLDDLDPFRLRRNNIGLGTTRALFQLRLLPSSRYLNSWRPVTGE
jgi:peptidoglycan/xylan/chitin deacetylase (PgdA/CDA1 family)